LPTGIAARCAADPPPAACLKPALEPAAPHKTLKTKTGIVHAIGVSNFSIVKLRRLLATARIRPSVNQVEAHPMWRNDALIECGAPHRCRAAARRPLLRRRRCRCRAH
jgi:diketogulonate reductase-like aldo/keto reductase